MAWEQLYNIFPDGAAEFDDIGYTSIEALQKNSDIKYVKRTLNKVARDMITKTFMDVFGPNGEYANLLIYDVYGDTEHPSETMPLNVYGMAMINDYINFHGLDTGIPYGN